MLLFIFLSFNLFPCCCQIPSFTWFKFFFVQETFIFRKTQKIQPMCNFLSFNLYFFVRLYYSIVSLSQIYLFFYCYSIIISKIVLAHLTITGYWQFSVAVIIWYWPPAPVRGSNGISALTEKNVWSSCVDFSLNRLQKTGGYFFNIFLLL